ncbi:phage portal protein [Streptomyces sp. NPDC048507]|uniref:phage portal protein n=1 Tax=Streptomyces sp. NPDC048507 TaxID=3365560 RepID=UPI003718DBD5
MDNPNDVVEMARRLIEARDAEKRRLDPIYHALHDIGRGLYVPKKVTSEYRDLIDQSKFNALPLVVASVAQGLYVDGYRQSDATDMSSAWKTVWQPNRMDARQNSLYRAAVTYGLSYALVLPGVAGAVPAPRITPLSPRTCTALYADAFEDEWPVAALIVCAGGDAKLVDDEFVHHLCLGEGGRSPQLGVSERHDLGVCPIVRISDSNDLDDGPVGKIQPLLRVQRQVDQTTYALLMAQQYSAFRQRWVTGMTIEEDVHGTPREPFNIRVDGLLHAESTDTKFGEFGQTDLNGYLDSRDRALLHMAAVARIPPHNLLIGGSVSNISAEALAALSDAHQMDLAEHKSTFGEGLEQMLRLGCLAIGDTEGWNDTASQVIWRDTQPRSLAQVADALGKLVQGLGIPGPALWDRVPGVTQQDIERWQAMADDQDALGALTQMLAPAPAPAAPTAVAAPVPPMAA